jgi:hypothetical protein
MNLTQDHHIYSFFTGLHSLIYTKFLFIRYEGWELDQDGQQPGLIIYSVCVDSFQHRQDIFERCIPFEYV